MQLVRSLYLSLKQIRDESYPTVVHLAVHLENSQRVYFTTSNIAQQAETSPATTLISFFAICQIDPFVRTLLFSEMPCYYTWNTSTKTFQRRKQGDQTNVPLLNPKQKEVYDTLMKAIEDGSGGLVFLDASGGTGKTFLMTLILATFRVRSDIVVAVAYSGIAATLSEGCETRMKRRRLLICWTGLQAGSGIVTCLLLQLLLWTSSHQAYAGIVPPPWSDPAKNPCASMRGGWQLLYWAPLKKCFKIFTLGYPCPLTMELSPTAVSAKHKDGPSAECRCPPGTALSALTKVCHTIYERGPCELGEYFQPMPDQAKRNGQRWGACKRPLKCASGMLFWPSDNKCYSRHTKGPCVKGKLLVRNKDGLAECRCDVGGELAAYYFPEEDTCYEHYTKGPCSTPGHIFMPGGRCDCQRHLPHYYKTLQMCFELDTPGPCPPGHIFRIPDDHFNDNDTDTNDSNILQLLPRAKCMCKEGYVSWSDGICYRLYTRGPCEANEFLINATSCITNFCGKNRLYFPEEESCYRIGSQGPCALHQVVVFDFTSRPSLDGISYNGICGCAGVITNLEQQCTNNVDQEQNICDATPGMVEINGQCHKLYTRGPCGVGQWLEPLKAAPGNGTALAAFGGKAKCVCRPGYTQADASTDGEQSGDGAMYNCSAPSVSLARWFLEIFG